MRGSIAALTAVSIIGAFAFAALGLAVATLPLVGRPARAVSDLTFFTWSGKTPQ